MSYFIDCKLIGFTRINMHRLINGDSLGLNGFVEDDQTFIISGWFDSDKIQLPFSDAIMRLGSVIYGDDLPETLGSDVMGFTNESRILEADSPVRFFKSGKVIVKNLFFDIYDRFSCLYINRASKLYYNPGHEELLSYPLNEDNDVLIGEVSSHFSVYIDHYIDTRKLSDSVTPDLCVGVFRNSSRLYTSINLLLLEPAKPDYKLTRNFKHINHPIYVHDNTEGCPHVFKPRVDCSMILDAHNRVRLENIVSCQPNFYYYHYNVDKCNDWGWGCAYRSIQTILSWFVENFNVTSHVLDIAEIQTLLPRIDFAHDKLQVGSKSWIGCLEASGILGELSGGRINCRVLHARTTQEIESFFFTEVRDHFIRSGCPVMVGAGNYAFTITGVISAEKSVFVLDPHYCENDGGSDVQRAISKGFVGLKSISKFFDFKKVRGDFMNILLPSID
jgi:hypothetical protein